MRCLVGGSLVAVFAGACSTPHATPDAARGDGGPFAAPHHAEPQLVSDGAIIAAPVIVPITFPDDPYVADIEKFSATIGASTYWATVASPYGVGAVGMASPIHVADAAPDITTEDTIRQWIASQLDGTHADWGTPDPAKIYSVFYPKTTQINLSLAGRTCIDNAGGYHDSVSVGGIEVVFSIVVECDAGIDGSTMLDALTVGFSHELIEAATDPFGTGWYVDPADYAVLAFADSGEIADLCEFSNVWFTPADLGYGVTRAWSNAAAATGHSPCVPALAAPYFNSAPVVGDTVHLQFSGYNFTTTGIKLRTDRAHHGRARSVQRRADVWSMDGVRAGRRDLAGRPASARV